MQRKNRSWVSCSENYDMQQPSPCLVFLRSASNASSVAYSSFSFSDNNLRSEETRPGSAHWLCRVARLGLCEAHPFLTLASSAFLALARSAAARLSVLDPSTPFVAVDSDLPAVFDVFGATTCTSSSESPITSGLPLVPIGGKVAVAFLLPAPDVVVRSPVAGAKVFALLTGALAVIFILACARRSAAKPDRLFKPAPPAATSPPPLAPAFAPAQAWSVAYR